MRLNLRQIVARFMYSIGSSDVHRRLGHSRGKRLLILMYHDITTDEARASGTTIYEDSPTASEFAAHIGEARRHFRVIALRDAIREINAGGLKEDTVCVTFDDGYASVHSVALPVLKRFDVPATVFVLTGWINREVDFWWHDLRAMVETASFAGVSSADLQDALGFSVQRLRTASRPNARYRVSLARSIEANLRNLEGQERAPILDRLRNLLIDEKMEILGHERALTWDQLAELEHNGVELASHTCSHINLRYAERDAVRRELVGSKKELERHTRRPVVGFAYPYGKDLEHYRHSEDLLRSLDFEYACTAFPGHNTDDSNLLSLRRVSPPLTSSVAMINRALYLGFVRANDFYRRAPHTWPGSLSRSANSPRV